MSVPTADPGRRPVTWRSRRLAGAAAQRAMIVLGVSLGLVPWVLGGTPADIQRAVVTGALNVLEEARARLRSEVPDASTDATELYLRAYVAWRLSYFHPRGSKPSNALLEEAEKDLGRVLAIDPDSAEALALWATVDGSRITGLWSAIRRGPRSARAYDRAFELAPENPRVVMLRGISRLFRPGPLGGGVERAEEELERASDLFAREPEERPWPNWGRAESLAWLGQTALRKRDPEKAAGFYREALDLEPDYHWVRHSLLPDLAERQTTGSGTASRREAEASDGGPDQACRVAVARAQCSPSGGR